MRISDWSSDVCSSDLSSVEMHANRSEASRLPDSLLRTAEICFRSNNLERKSTIIVFVRAKGGTDASQACHDPRHQIGRASCRERVCQYGVARGGRSIIKKNIRHTRTTDP